MLSIFICKSEALRRTIVEQYMEAETLPFVAILDPRVTYREAVAAVDGLCGNKVSIIGKLRVADIPFYPDMLQIDSEDGQNIQISREEWAKAVELTFKRLISFNKVSE